MTAILSELEGRANNKKGEERWRLECRGEVVSANVELERGVVE